MRPRPYSCTPEPLIHAASGVFRALTRLCARRPACLRPGCLGMKKERRSPRRPFPVKICENSRPPSRRPCPLSLDIPGFSHVLPSCPALSRFSQLSCLFTVSDSGRSRSRQRCCGRRCRPPGAPAPACRPGTALLPPSVPAERTGCGGSTRAGYRTGSCGSR